MGGQPGRDLIRSGQVGHHLEGGLLRPARDRAAERDGRIRADRADEPVRERLKSAGYQDSTPVNNHPYRKRIYFFDDDGNDWEFVQYLTDDPAKRHDYTIPDK